jgi:hypothetical protein
MQLYVVCGPPWAMAPFLWSGSEQQAGVEGLFGT